MSSEEYSRPDCGYLCLFVSTGRFPKLTSGCFVRWTERGSESRAPAGGAGPRPETQTGENLQQGVQLWVRQEQKSQMFSAFYESDHRFCSFSCKSLRGMRLTDTNTETFKTEVRTNLVMQESNYKLKHQIQFVVLCVTVLKNKLERN